MKEFFKEFKEFISRGNVVDLAVAVVIGNAFNAIVTSLVNDIIMPIMGMVIGGINFSGLNIVYKESVLRIGLFVQNIINFLIIALSIFAAIKIMAFITDKRRKPEKEKEEPKKPKDIELLEEIRDLLKNKSK